MDRNTFTKRTEEQAVEPSQFDRPSAKVIDSESQGTDSDRRTWCSEGTVFAVLGRCVTSEPRLNGSVLRSRRPDQPLRVGARPRLDRIAEQAQQYPEMKFFTLAHHLDVAMLERAFWSLNPKIAAGVDRVTWQQYKRELEFNLEVLQEKLGTKTYHPQPVVRRWIPKGDGQQFRPLGIPALEDKIAAKAVALLLEQIYEQDFCDFSYGFCPGRSCHKASHDLRQGLLNNGIRFVIDCDIRSFFDNLQHDDLLAILRERVTDGRVLELIRYADDFIIGCQHEEDARRIMKVLPQRFAKYGLARIIHEFDRVRRKPFVRNELRLSYLFHTAPAAALARMRKRGERRWFHERTECR